MKKIMSAALALAMTLTLAPTAFAAGGTAYASTQAVEVDGKKIEFQMYALKDASGNGTNYVKLRDVAHVLNGTGAQFSVGYDNASKSIAVTTGAAYADTGTEMTTPYSGDRAYQTGSGTVLVNGAPASLDAIVLTDDAGGGYTYFKLRDLGSALGFTVDWTADRGVIVETGGSTQPTTPAVGFTLESLQGIWYAEIEESWGLELSIQGNQFTETYIIYDPDFAQQNYVTGTIVSVTESIEKGEISGDIPVITLELSNVTETTIEDGKITTENSTTSDRYYITRNGTFLTRAELPFTRIPAVKLYPEFQAALEAAQSEPSTPDDTDINPMDYAYTAMDYLYDHLKFPSTMDVSAVKCGKHVSSHIFEKTDNVYVVTITYKAANSFGALRTDNYVTMFNLTTGKTMFDAVGYTKSMIDGSWGAAKSKAYMKNSEALGLSGGGTLSTELTREQIQSLVDQIKK